MRNSVDLVLEVELESPALVLEHGREVVYHVPLRLREGFSVHVRVRGHEDFHQGSMFGSSARACASAPPTGGGLPFVKDPPPEPKTTEDPILEACRVFQGIQRAARQAKRDRWSSQMLG